MRATVRSIGADVDLPSWSPEDPLDVGISVRLAIGPVEEDFADEFELTVCTPRWLAREAAQQSPLMGVHHVIVPEWDYLALQRWLDAAVHRVEAPIWTDLALKIGRLARWSLEDVTPVDVTGRLCTACGYAVHSAFRLIDDRCPACGFQPDVAEGDAYFTPAEWREYWVARGMQWTSTTGPAPSDWNPIARLHALDVLIRRDASSPVQPQTRQFRAVVGDMISPDADLKTFRPSDPAVVHLFIQVFVGQADDHPAGEALNLMVTTPGWFEATVTEPTDGRHELIVDHWDFPQIEHFIRSYVSELQGESWDDLARQFGRLGYWEFEDLAHPWGTDL